MGCYSEIELLPAPDGLSKDTCCCKTCLVFAVGIYRASIRVPWHINPSSHPVRKPAFHPVKRFHSAIQALIQPSGNPSRHLNYNYNHNYKGIQPYIHSSNKPLNPIHPITSQLTIQPPSHLDNQASHQGNTLSTRNILTTSHPASHLSSHPAVQPSGQPAIQFSIKPTS